MMKWILSAVQKAPVLAQIIALAILIGLASVPLHAAPSPSATPMMVLPAGQGVTPSHISSGASTNSTLISASNHVVFTVAVDNTSGSAVFVKLYNKATAPTCGTDAPVKTIQVNSNSYVEYTYQPGIQFPLGLGVCATGAYADSDTTNTTTGIGIDIGYN